MTMRILVVNEDQTRTAILRKVEFDPKAADGKETPELYKHELLPGASMPIYIHAGCRIEVTEKE